MTTDPNRSEPGYLTLSRHKAMLAARDVFAAGGDVVMATPTHQQAGYVMGVMLDTHRLSELPGIGVRRAAGSLAVMRTDVPRAHAVRFMSHHAGGERLRGLSADMVVLFNPSEDAIVNAQLVTYAQGGRVVVVRASS